MRVLAYLIISLVIAGCGGSESQKNVKVISVEDYETRTFSVEAKDAEVEGLLGTVTQDEIERVFGAHRSAMLRCYEDAIYDLEEIEGELKLPEGQRIDFVSITTPNNWHFPIAKANIDKPA